MGKHVATVRPEEEFDSGSFRMREQAPGFRLRLGRPKNGGTMLVQACEFDADKYDEKRAREAMARHGLACKSFACAEKEGAKLADAAEGAPVEEGQTVNRIVEREDGTFDLEGVEVLEAGVFEASRGGKVRVTADDINAIAADTQANLSLLRPPAKLGHTDNPFPDGKGAPALGWVGNVYARGEKLLVDFTKVPAAFVEALKKGRWRTRSAELMRWKNPQTGKTFDRVLKAVAWLGAEMPAVQSLADVVALNSADIDWTEVRACVDGGCVLDFYLTAAEEPIAPADPGGDRLSDNPTGEESSPDDDETPTDTETETQEDVMAETKTAEDVARQEALDAAADARGELIEATLELAVATGRLTPGDVDAEKAFATENLQTLSAVRGWADRLKARPALPDQTKALGTTNLPDDEAEASTEEPKDELEALSGEEWLDARAQQILEKKKWDFSRYEDALLLASKENADKTEEYFSTAYPGVNVQTTKRKGVAR